MEQTQYNDLSKRIDSIVESLNSQREFNENLTKHVLFVGEATQATQNHVNVFNAELLETLRGLQENQNALNDLIKGILELLKEQKGLN